MILSSPDQRQVVGCSLKITEQGFLNTSPIAKPVPLGPPLAMSEADLAALELPPSQEVIDAAVADWVRYAPQRARAYVFAKVENVVDEAK